MNRNKGVTSLFEKIREVAQAGSAPGLGPGGRRFESCLPDNPPTLQLNGVRRISFVAYYVYILRSLRDNKFYIGSCSNIQARINFHNAGLQRTTKNRIPFILVLSEEYKSKKLALIREKQIKSWKGGEAFQKLIRGK